MAITIPRRQKEKALYFPKHLVIVRSFIKEMEIKTVTLNNLKQF